MNQYKKHKQIISAIITTATGLDKSLQEKVLAIVTGGAKSEVELTEKINKDLIGGFILRIGDQQVDASILRQIKNLDRSFSENPNVKGI